MSLSHSFDWYQATIPAPPKAVLDACLAQMEGAHDVEHSDRGGNGYKASARIRDREGDTLGILRHGGNNHPNLQFSSHNAQAGALLIRKEWPVHRVSRADVACDFDGPGLYDAFVDRARAIADEHRVTSGREIRPDAADAGRTYYLGKPASNVMARIYEKGLEQRAKGVADASETWTRIELQARPQKEAKSEFATLSADALWGASAWSRSLSAVCLEHDAARVLIDPRRVTDWERRMGHLVFQNLPFALDLGARLCAQQDGDLAPSARDRIRAFVDRFADELEREHGIRSGATRMG